MDLFFRRTKRPSRSTSSTPMRPLVRAWWEKLVRLSLSSSFLFLDELEPEKWIPCPLCEDGLGDSLNLQEKSRRIP